MQCHWRHLERPPTWEGHKCPHHHHDALLRRSHKEPAPEDRASVGDSSTDSRHARWVCSEHQLFSSSFLPFLKKLCVDLCREIQRVCFAQIGLFKWQQ